MLLGTTFVIVNCLIFGEHSSWFTMSRFSLVKKLSWMSLTRRNKLFSSLFQNFFQSLILLSFASSPVNMYNALEQLECWNGVQNSPCFPSVLFCCCIPKIPNQAHTVCFHVTAFFQLIKMFTINVPMMERINRNISSSGMQGGSFPVFSPIVYLPHGQLIILHMLFWNLGGDAVWHSLKSHHHSKRYAYSLVPYQTSVLHNQ